MRGGTALPSRPVRHLPRPALPYLATRPTPNQGTIEAAIRGVLTGGLYLPIGNPLPGPKFDYKLAWMGNLLRRATGLHGMPEILTGNFNIVPTDADIHNTRSCA